MSNHTVFKFAHQLASKCPSTPETVDKIVGVEAFKDFLLHLFVLSILWVHFKHADNWQEGHDVGNQKLTLNEFKMACRTFTSAQAHETLTEQKIINDFSMLDTDHDNSVDFGEVSSSFEVI